MMDTKTGLKIAYRRKMPETLRTLSFAKEKHAGQYRKGDGSVPYIVHPLNMACHALAMGIYDDAVIAAALLHDVCEDCDIAPDKLPVSETVRRAVSLLTFAVKDGETKAQARSRYFCAIIENREAVIVKLLDRCNNVSFMAHGFSPSKLGEYIEETRKFILPLLTETRRRYPEFYDACFLLKYQICCVINSLEAVLSMTKNRTEI